MHTHTHIYIHTVACQISQSVNITSTQYHVLVVTGDTNVGLLTLITKVIGIMVNVFYQLSVCYLQIQSYKVLIYFTIFIKSGFSLQILI